MLRKILATTSAFLFVTFTPPAMASQALSDRLVLEVNGNSYTQRQLTLYSTVKAALQKSRANDLVGVSEKTWSEALTLFKNEMLLEQEALRLNSFQPNRKMIDAAMTIVELRRKESPEFDRFLEQQAASSKTLRRVLASILRVWGFLLSKERQGARPDGVTESEAGVQADADWFVKLEQRTPYRFYEEAAVYRAIHPAPGAGSGSRGVDQ